MRYRVIFAGTPDFAIPALTALAESEIYEVVAVLTQTDKPVGRKRIVTPPPVKLKAQELDIPVLQPAKVNLPDSLEQIRTYAPDILITAAYGQIFKAELLNLPRCGCINLHASLLPLYRGAAPVQRALMDGHSKTGVSIMRMDIGCDTGDVYCSQDLKIDPQENYSELLERLAKCAADLLLDHLEEIITGKLLPVTQDSLGEASHAPRITNLDCPINWQQSAQIIHNQVRALAPQPGAVAEYGGRRVKILKTDWLDQEINERPGTLVDNRKQLCVACGQGLLIIKELQPAGRQVQAAAEVAHNYQIGSIFA